MEVLAPNVSSLAGPIIGARLISLTGGLQRLSQVSSSTIQVLGAEKALFRHLRDGELPPKHGILFQHPYLHNAPYWQRGKIARALAGKIAIAAKLDQNSDKIMSDELEADIKRRLEEIQKKYPKAPAKKSKKTRRTEKGRNLGKGKGKRTRRAGRGRGRGQKRSKGKRWD
jgi:nucleolar protein 56